MYAPNACGLHIARELTAHADDTFRIHDFGGSNRETGGRPSVHTIMIWHVFFGQASGKAIPGSSEPLKPFLPSRRIKTASEATGTQKAGG